MRPAPALLALLALALPALAALDAPRPRSAPSCRVQATYRPLAWPAWTPPEARLRRITVRLRPGCPPGGAARIHYRNAYGRTLPERALIVLTPEAPAHALPGWPPSAGVGPSWRPYWVAASGAEYAVPLRPAP